MAYTSAEGGYGASASVFHFSPSHSDTVSIPDAELLFTGDFKRHGPDLILTGHDGRHHVVPGYFSSEKHPALVAPNGASLSAALVDLLAGSPTPGQFAQASPTPTDPIGKVEKVVGHVVVIRNGVAVALNVGDAVYKSDIIQTGANSSCGLDFPDGTALNLVANTRMALNDYSYDPNGNSNDALFSLVQGTFAFVAGKVAHTGDMKIETPVATMGIRGTTGFVQEQIGTISANIGNVTYSFAVVEDYGTGRVGQYELIDPQGNVVATVSQNGFLTYVTPQGTDLPPIVTTQPMSNTQLGFEQQIIQQVFQVLNSGTNPNPQSNPGSNGSGTDQEHNLPQLLQNNNGSGNNASNGSNLGGHNLISQASSITSIPVNTTAATPVVTWIGPSAGDWNNPYNWSDGVVPLSWEIVDLPGQATLSGSATIAGLVTEQGALLNIIGSGNLTVSNAIDNYGTVQLDPGPTLAINGTVYLYDGGTISMIGPGPNYIIAAGTRASLVNTDNTIEGSGTIGATGAGAGWLTLDNVTNPTDPAGITPYGTINAVPLVAGDSGGLIIETGNTVINSGLMEATVSAFGAGKLEIYDEFINQSAGVTELFNPNTGLIAFINPSIGVIAANGASASVIVGDNLQANTDLNYGTIEAVNGGILTIENTTIDNSTFNLSTSNPNISAGLDGLVEAGAGSTIVLDGATILQGFVYVAGGEIETDSGTFNEIETANQQHNLNIPTLINAGTILVADYSSLVLQSPYNIENSGTVELDSTGNTTTLYFNQLAPILSGGGQIVLEGGQHARDIIAALVDPSQGLTLVSLDNQNNTISGDGAIGQNDGLLQLQNDSLASIDANLDSQSLTIETGNTVTNTGTLEATNGGILAIDDNITNTGGTIAASGASSNGTVSLVQLNGVTITGGTITDDASFVISGNSEIEGTSIAKVSINGTGTLTINPDATLTLDDVTVSGTTITEETTGSLVQVDSGDTLTLEGSATISSGAITNLDSIVVAGPATLADDTLTNSGATLTIDATDTLTLNGTTISGGTITDNGTIDVTGSSKLDGSLALNGGNVTVETATLTLDDVTVSGTTITEETTGSLVQVDSGDTLTLEGSATISSGAITNLDSIVVAGPATLADDTLTNSGATLTIDATDTLTLNGTTISGGTITDNGTIDVTGSSKLDGSLALNGGNVTVETATLTLDDVTVSGTTITEETTGSLVQVDSGDTLTLEGSATISSGAITNLDSIVVAGPATLADDTLTNSGATLTIDATDTLTLNGTTISGGTITDNGTIDVTGSSKLDGSLALNGGNVTVETATLTLDDVTVSGTTITEETTGSLVQVDSGDTLTLEGSATISSGAITNLDSIVVAGPATLADDTLTNSGATLTIDATDTLTLNGTTISGGTITDNGTIDVTGSSKLDGSLALNGGNVTVETATLTLDDVTVSGTTITEETTGSLVQVDSGDTLTLEGSATISSGAITNLDSIVVAGPATLADDTLTNSGATLTIDATDTLTLNGTTISGGTITDNGTIDVTGSSKLDGSLALNGGNVTVETATLTLDDVTVSGTTITEETTGSLVQVDSGDTLTLEGSATISSGAITNLDSIVVAGPATLADDTLTNSGATLTIDATDTLTLNGTTISGGTITDNGTIDVTGSSKLDGSLALNGGNVTVETATLTLDDVTVSGTTITEETTGSLVQVDSGDTLTLEGSATISSGAITNLDSTIYVSGSGNEIENENGNNGTPGTDIFTNAGTLEVLAGGVLTLSNDSVTNTNGTITVDPDPAITPAAGQLILTDTTITNGALGNNGMLDLTGGDTIQTGAFDNSGSGTVTVSSTGNAIDSESSFSNTGTIDVTGTLTLNTDTVENFAAGPPASYGTITVEGTLDLTGSDTIDNGALGNNGGTIYVSGSGNEIENENGNNGTSGTNIFTNAGTLEVLAGGVLTLSNDSVTNTNGTITVDDGATLTLSGVTIDGGSIVDDGTLSVTADSEISAAISGGGDVTVTSGTLTLTGTNGYSGATTINGGSLALADGGSIADSTEVSINGTGNLNITAASGNESIITLSGVSGTTVTLGANNLILTDASGDYEGAIDGCGGLTLTTGTETLSGDNTYTGSTTINGGTLKLSGSGSIADSSGVADAGSFDISLTTSGASIKTLSGSGDVTLGAETLTLSDASTTFSGSIGNAGADTGGLTVDGSGTETLSGVNTYTGSTTINGGTLKLSGSGSIADSSGVADAGSFDISLTTSGASIKTLSGSGDVTLGAETLTLSDASTTFSGSIGNAGADTGGLTVDGSGTETLSGVNTYSGATSIGSGETLALSGSGSIAASSGLTDDGTFDISNTSNGASITTLSGSGDVTLGTQTLTLTAATGTFSGAINDTGGLTLTTGTETLSGATITAGTLVDDGTITVGSTDAASTISVNTATIATGAYVKADGGSLTVSDNSSDNSGTLEAIDGGTLQIDSNVDNAGGTIEATGTNSVVQLVNTTIAGGTLSTGDLIDGNDGTIKVGSDESVLDGSVNTVTIDGYVQVDAGASLELKGTIDDGGLINIDPIAGPSGANLVIEGIVTLNGGGTVVVQGASDEIIGTPSGTLDNYDTISGTGAIGDGTTDLSLDNETGATINADGATPLTINTGTNQITNSGTLEATNGGTLDIESNLDNTGTLEANGGTLSVASTVTITGTGGSVLITGGGTADFADTLDQGVTFQGAGNNILELAHSGSLGAVTGFGNATTGTAGNVIDLQDVQYNATTEYDVWTQNTGSGTLQIYTGATLDQSLTFNGTCTYTQNSFALTSDGSATPGTDVVASPLSVTNNNGVETATTVSPSATLNNEDGHWVVQDSGYTTTLGGAGAVDGVVINGQTYLLVGDGGFSTIQAAIDQATTGDTILVAPGTYTEQDIVDSTHGASGITIEGVGGPGAVTVDAPTTLEQTGVSPVSGNSVDGILTVNGVSNVTIENLTVNGLENGANFDNSQTNPSLIGIAYLNSTGGDIDGVTVTGTRESDAGIGDQRNFGIYVANTDTLSGDVPSQTEAAALNTITISNSTIENFQKAGIIAEYADVTISGNTLAGVGEVNTAQNAIQVDGATGTVSNNTITAIGYSGDDAAATGVLAFDNYGLDITDNSFTGALDDNGHVLVSPVGYYVIDSTNGEIENNSAANVDDGIAVVSEGFGGGDTDQITGVWTISGNTTTNVVLVSDGGASIYFDPDPTTAASTFVATGGASDVGDVFFVSPGTDTLTGGGGGGNTFVVLNGPDLSATDSINGGGGSDNTIDFASATSGDTLTIGSNVTNIQSVEIGTFDANGNFIATNTANETVDVSAYSSPLTVVGNDGNDTFYVLSGTDTIQGGSGFNTVNYSAPLAADDFSIVSNQWTVSNGTDGADTLSGVQDVTDGTHIFLMVGNGAYSDVTAASAPGTAASGDILIVDSGTDNSVQTVGTDGLTIDELANSTTLTLQLGSGVSSITLADYAPGQGANVTVTGNNAGDTIVGNDGNDTLDPAGPGTLTGGAGATTFVYSNGYGAVTITNFDQGGGGFSQSQGEVINLTGEISVHNLSEVQADATQNGANTVITFTSGDILTLDDVTASQLTAADFTLSPPPPPNEPFVWATNESGNWTDPGSWNDNGYYPGQYSNADQVEVNATSGSIVVSYDATEAIDSLTTNSNATLYITAGSLTVSANGSVNAGTIDVSGGATLTLDGSIDNSGGTVEATGTNSAVDIFNATISGGTLETSSGGIVQAPTDASFDNVTLAGGNFETNTNFSIDLQDTTTLSGAVTFEGGGTFELSGGTIQGPAPGVDPTLENDASTIAGAGTIGDGTGDLTLTNNGTIDANVSGETLTINTGQQVDNGGTLEATNGGQLTVEDTVDNAGGNVSAAGGFIDFWMGITGGNATISDGGKLQYGWSSDVATAFDGAGTLVLNHQDQSDTNFANAQYTGTVSGFGAGDTVDLTDVTYSPSEYAVWTQTSTTGGGSGTLAIYSSTGTPEASLNLNGIYVQNEFALASDGSSANNGNPGTDIDFNYVSFNNGKINQESSSYDPYTPQIGPAGNTLQLTNDNPTEAASWFATNQVSVSSNFTASFDYQATSASSSQPGGLADGFAFILQDSSAGLGALGADGGELGYGPNESDPSNGRGGTAISPSAAVELNLYDYGGSLVPGTAFATDGSTGSYTPTGSVNFWSTGDTIQVVLSYSASNETLTETLTDLVTGATYATAYTGVDLASILGSNIAYVGFSGGDGGNTSTQIVSNFSYFDPVTDNWNGGTGEWSNGSNWSAGVPGADGAVDITASGAIVTFDSSASPDTIHSLDSGTDTTLDITAGTLAVAGGSITFAGAIEVSGGTFTVASNVSSNADGGMITISGGSLVNLQDVADPNVAFAGPGILELGHSTSYDGTISGYADSSILDLADINFISGTTTVSDANHGANSDTLTVTGDTLTATIVIGSNSALAYPTDWAVASDGAGGTLVVDPDVTVTSSNTSTNAASASGAQTVLFANGTGTLDLANPSTFTGEIAGFTGTAANAADSDVIDLAGINYNSGSFTENYNSNTGVLTVSDGTNGDSLTFVDFTGTFKFGADGNGGTDIYDPPATNSPSAVSVGQDSFVFHPNLGAESGNAATSDSGTAHEHSPWAHNEEWSALIADTQATGAVDVAQPADSHWHHALHNATHLH